MEAFIRLLDLLFLCCVRLKLLWCVSARVCACPGEVGQRWHAYGQQLAVEAHSGHSARPTLVPGVLPTESRRRWRLREAVELLQAAAQVALLQQPEQL